MIARNLIAAAAATAALSFSAMPAVAQDGQYGPALQKVLTSAIGGKCDTELMAADVLAACEAQLPQMAPMLSMLGTVQSVTFVSAEDSPEGRVETWTVVFSSGESMNWIIGGRVEGKYSVLGTAG